MVSPAKDTGSIILTDMPTKLNTEIVAAAIAGFEQQKKQLDAQIAELRNLLSPNATDSNTLAPKKRGRMSAAARARIAAAQRKRWAAARNQAQAASSTAPARKKRRLSAAGRKAIIEATKRRWAARRTARPQ
jgi:peptidoglycan hydrolase CwlO-like protein